MGKLRECVHTLSGLSLWNQKLESQELLVRYSFARALHCCEVVGRIAWELIDNGQCSSIAHERAPYYKVESGGRKAMPREWNDIVQNRSDAQLIILLISIFEYQSERAVTRCGGVALRNHVP